MKRNGTLILLLIMLAGIIMQLAMLFLVMEPNELKWYDPNDYLRIARELAQGDAYSTADNERNLYRAPGYPMLLSLMINIVGEKVVSVRLFHILLFPVFLYFLYRLGRDWKNEFTGLMLAFLAIIYPFFIYVPLTLYPEALLLYLLPFIAWLMLKNGNDPHWLWLLFSGAMIALAILIRPTAIFILPVFVLYVVLKSGWKWQKFLSAGILVCLIPVLAVSGWMLRNYNIHGKAMFSSAGGYNLLMSYNDNASIAVKLDYPLPVRIQERLAAADSKEEYENIARDEALAFIKKNPAKALKLSFFKLLDLWNPFPRTTTSSGFARPQFKIISAIPYIIFLILGFFGFLKNRRDGFVIALLFLTLLNCLLNGIIAVSVRYRLITDFAFLLLAADVITGIWAKKTRNNHKRDV
ncbi:MAG: glycosyltransferase family 39 protein [Candidatus Cloacimonetes bacterium]|nr:glycosyltransferase family 39 protein [Candidatus Cloacimonadota bacterium]